MRDEKSSMPIDKNNISIAKKYYVFSAIISFFIVFLCLWFTWSVYSKHKTERDFKLSAKASQVDKILSNSFSQVTNYMRIIGKLIVESDNRNIDYISNILKNFGEEFEIQSTGSRTGFDWISPNHYITANSSNGIIKYPIDVSSRDYIKGSTTNPQQLHLSPPSYGLISAEWIIPSAMGFNDREGNYIGAISLGFSINYLVNKIDNGITTNIDTNYVVIDKDMNIVLQSYTNDIVYNNSFFKDYKNIIDDSVNSGNINMVKTIETEDGIVYSSILKMKNTPYTIIVGYNKSEYISQVLNKLYPTTLALIGVGLLFIAILRIFAQNIILPIVTLSEAADKISRGEKNVVFPEKAPYEVYNLSQQISNINNYINRIKKIKKANEEAELLKEKAIKASQAKSDLLALVSHELRTPLNAIINFSEIQRSQLFGPMNNDKYLEYAKDINESGIHLLQLINNILDITKAEANKIELIESNVNIKNIVNICIRTLSEHAAKNGVKISYNEDKNIPNLYADELCLKQIMINLMSNSVSYTNSGGEVKVSSSVHLSKDNKKQYHIIVEDNGIGIDEKDLNIVMEKFGQASGHSNIRKSKGTGLGLPLTKTLVELHKGKFILESSIGKGTKVTMIFNEERIIYNKSTIVSKDKETIDS